MFLYAIVHFDQCHRRILFGRSNYFFSSNVESLSIQTSKQYIFFFFRTKINGFAQIVERYEKKSSSNKKWLIDCRNKNCYGSSEKYFQSATAQFPRLIRIIFPKLKIKRKHTYYLIANRILLKHFPDSNFSFKTITLKTFL